MKTGLAMSSTRFLGTHVHLRFKRAYYHKEDFVVQEKVAGWEFEVHGFAIARSVWALGTGHILIGSFGRDEMV